MLQGHRKSPKKEQIDKLVERYGATGFMYTEYPHKRFWDKNCGDEQFKSALATEMGSSEDNPTLLYIHLPFCQELCWFCTCHVSITNNYDKVVEYLEWLYKEIDLLSQTFQDNSIKPVFTEIHLGGGSPTFLKEPEFDALVERLNKIVNTDTLQEFSIEIDPRRVDRERMEYYHKKGINRISFGIQDFDLNVQKAINRVQPVELIENLLTPDIRNLFPNGVNFDVICGLPHQTPESIRVTAKECVRLSPDRICFNYLHFAPQFAQHQENMCDGKNGRPSKLPDYSERKNLFGEGLKVLSENGGYVRTGYDHFALATDEVAKSMESGQLHWNSLGVTAGRYLNVIGIGVHSYSTIGKHYFQNVYEINDYQAALTKGELPVYRGHELSADDLLRRDIIQRIRNYFYLSIVEIEKLYGIDFNIYFEPELRKLKQFIEDGLVETTDEAIVVTETGYQFTNIVCRIFDKYYDGELMAKDLGELTLKGDLLTH
ncbi:oxygen-independent coproporphyrinogen III oxidase [Nitrospinae bacterium]|nr:oxygen-independent coproporphyrinogen III oxidase [Nitrospinota bacterium]